MNRYQVFLSPEAKTMLEDQIDFLAQLNSDAAVKLKDNFMKALRSLETMPQRYPFLESEYIKFGKYRKMLVEKRYLVIYQFKDNNVYVDYIVDCRADYGSGIK